MNVENRTNLIRSGLELGLAEVDGNNFLGLGRLWVARGLTWSRIERGRTWTSDLDCFNNIGTISW